MKRSLIQQMILVAMVFCIGSVQAQMTVKNQFAKDYIQTNYEALGVQKEDVSDLHLQDSYTDERTGATYFYFIQRHEGIEIYNAVLNMAVNSDNKVINIGNRLVDNIALKASQKPAKLTASEAVMSAAEHFEAIAPNAKVNLQLKEKKSEHEMIFHESGLSRTVIPAKLCYVPTKKEGLKLAWNLSIDMLTSDDYWSARVDATEGTVIDQNNFTVYCNFGEGDFLKAHECEGHVHHHEAELPAVMAPGSYTVFALPAESPTHAPQSVVTNANDSIASPFGWHDIDGEDGHEFTITRGNNVHAYLDLGDTNNSSGDEPDGGDDLIFDFPYDYTVEPDQLRDAAVTNLFYMNNMIHDITYQYGFTELAGNFQENNYGNGGTGGDAVQAQAQDGGGENNANFSTPGDGASGRMQMYLWNAAASSLLHVDEPAEAAGWYPTGTASYGPAVDANTEIIGELAEAKDILFNPYDTDACEEISNDIAGKIALVDRGGCWFQQKTYNCEQAGAIAVVICNFGPEPMGMGPANGPNNFGNQTIPTISLGVNDCVRLRQYIEDGVTVTIKPRSSSGPQRVDGDFDNGIIAHEYGHGISNRLTGGRFQSGCLSNTEQMGEGWSDFFTMVTTAKIEDRERPRGVGTFAEKQDVDGRGIRPYPYSIDMDVNPMTYEDITQFSIPHGLGSVWCTMLWDLYWAMTDQYGFDEDVAHGEGGNNKAIALVMEGMRLQACSPGFVDGRDGILAADEMLFNGENKCLIWKVFARRGLGYLADQGDSDIVGDEKESFEPLPICIEELKLAKAATPLAKAGDDVSVALTLTNHKTSAVTDVVITDALPDGLTFVEIENVQGVQMSSVVVDTDNSNEVKFTLDLNDGGGLAAGEEVVITYKAATDPDKYSIQLYLDDIPDASSSTNGRWLIDTESEPADSPNVWEITSDEGNNDNFSWNVDDIEVETRQLLIHFEPIRITGTQPVLRFYQRYDSYPGQHGGVLELSKDGAVSFQNNADIFFRNGYSGLMPYSAFTIPNFRAFSGQSGDFIDSYVDLSDYDGDDVFFRFRFGTTDITEQTLASYFGSADGGDGWFIDDFEIMDMFNYDGQACASSAEGDSPCANAPGRGIIMEQGSSSPTKELGLGTEFSLYPNPASETIHLAFTANEAKELNIRVLTMDGKIIHQQQRSVYAGKQVFGLNVDKFPAGVYFVNIQSDDASVTEKVIIE